MMLILIGLVIVGIGIYKMYKDHVERYSDQVKFNNYTLEYIKSVNETLDRLQKDDD